MMNLFEVGQGVPQQTGPTSTPEQSQNKELILKRTQEIFETSDISSIWNSLASLNLFVIQKISENLSPIKQEMLLQVALSRIKPASTTPLSSEEQLPYNVTRAVREARCQELSAIRRFSALCHLLATEFSIHIPEEGEMDLISDQTLVGILAELRNQVNHHLRYLPTEITTIFHPRAAWEIVRDPKSCFLFFQLVYSYNLISFVHALNPNIEIPRTISLGLVEDGVAKAKEWLQDPVHAQTISRVSLSNSPITLLPSDIERCSNLTELLLQRTLIYSLPSAIGHLTQLRILNLEESRICCLPQECTLLPALQQLILSRTPIAILPSNIGRLKNLEVLCIARTKISELPESMAGLSSLAALDLSWTPIKKLSPVLGKLTGLTALNLSALDISSLPDAIQNLRLLEILDISATKIERLPPNMKKLFPRLQYLNVTMTPMQK